MYVREKSFSSTYFDIKIIFILIYLSKISFTSSILFQMRLSISTICWLANFEKRSFLSRTPLQISFQCKVLDWFSRLADCLGCFEKRYDYVFREIKLFWRRFNRDICYSKYTHILRVVWASSCNHDDVFELNKLPVNNREWRCYAFFIPFHKILYYCDIK